MSNATNLINAMADNKNFDLGAFCMGNGTTISDRKREKYGDYKRVAHVSDGGTIKFWDDKFEAAAGRFISYNGANGEATITTAQDAAADRNAADLVDGFGGWFN